MQCCHACIGTVAVLTSIFRKVSGQMAWRSCQGCCGFTLCTQSVLQQQLQVCRPTVPDDVQGIDLVIKSVEAMVQPVETLEFPVFEKSMAPQWQAIKVLFMSSNEKIKDATRELIDVSFRYANSHLVP